MKKVCLEEVSDRGSSNVAQKDIEGLSGDYPIYGAAGYIGNVNFYHRDSDYIAVVKDGAGIGRTMFLPAKSSVIGTLQYILPKETVVSKYLFYAVKNMRLEKYYTGAAIPHIYYKDYKKEQFWLPDKIKQQKVVGILGKVERVIKERQQEIKYLDDLIKSRFVEMFGEPVTNPKKLQVVALGELSELITKGASPNWQGFSYTDDSTKTLFVTSENVREGYIDISSPKYIEDEFNKKQKRSVLHKGDFLINIVGASIGRVAQFDLNCKANINQAVSLVRINDVRVLDKYLLVYLNSDKAQQMYNLMKSDTGRANLSLQDISTLSILLPPIEEQRKFELFVDHIDKLKFLHKQTLSILHHRRFIDVKF